MKNQTTSAVLTAALLTVAGACTDSAPPAEQTEPASTTLSTENDRASFADDLLMPGGDRPLPADRVFVPGAYAADANTIEFGIRILPGYYVYKDKFELRSLTDGVRAEKPILPDGDIVSDEWFGEQEVYYDEVFAPASLRRHSETAQEVAIELTYQGCKIDGICYLPVTKTLTVSLPARVAYDD